MTLHSITRLYVITVQQPWAWAIAVGAKPVENRTWFAGYTGPLAIHAGKTDDPAGWKDPRVAAAMRGRGIACTPNDPRPRPAALARGAVVAVVDQVGCHSARRTNRVCCAPWGAPEQFHHLYDHVRQLAEPVELRGQLGLRVVPADLAPTILERAR